MPLRAPVRAVNSVCNDGCANDMRIIVITGPSGQATSTQNTQLVASKTGITDDSGPVGMSNKYTECNACCE